MSLQEAECVRYARIIVIVFEVLVLVDQGFRCSEIPPSALWIMFEGGVGVWGGVSPLQEGDFDRGVWMMGRCSMSLSLRQRDLNVW
jgi:hypothetical protein